MKLTDEIKKQIDGMSYGSLLYRWRFSPPGDPWFTGEVGEYYSKVIAEKRDADPDIAVAVSKAIGWER